MSKYVLHVLHRAENVQTKSQWLHQRFASLSDVIRYARNEANLWFRTTGVAASATVGCVYTVKRSLLDPKPAAVFYTDERGRLQRVKMVIGAPTKMIGTITNDGI